MLGFVKQRDAWRTPFEIRQLGAGKVWHDKFGWLPRAHVERYEQGQRYYAGRWMPAAEETALCARFAVRVARRKRTLRRHDEPQS